MKPMRAERNAAVLAAILLFAAAPLEGLGMSKKPEELPFRPPSVIDGERPAEMRVADFALG